MAKEWARKFYQSKNWISARNYIMHKYHYMCQCCKEKPADIVHHIIWLNPNNINDPIITLSEDNLIPVCRECHAIIHEGVNATVGNLAFDSSGQLIERNIYGFKSYNK